MRRERQNVWLALVLDYYLIIRLSTSAVGDTRTVHRRIAEPRVVACIDCLSVLLMLSAWDESMEG